MEGARLVLAKAISCFKTQGFWWYLSSPEPRYLYEGRSPKVPRPGNCLNATGQKLDYLELPIRSYQLVGDGIETPGVQPIVFFELVQCRFPLDRRKARIDIPPPQPRCISWDFFAHAFRVNAECVVYCFEIYWEAILG